MSGVRIERRYHRLWRNKGSKRPKAIVFLDAEAAIAKPAEWREEHSFRLAVVCLCEYSPEEGLQEQEWQEFTSEVALWDWVIEVAQRYKKLQVVAHRMDYDARLCRAFSILPQAGWSPSYCIMSVSCTLFEFECDEHKIILLDNMNLWRGTLAQLGESVGLPKGNVDFENVSDEVLFPYCRRDVEILVRMWQEWFRFLDDHNLGTFAITSSGQAFNAYRHRFLQEKISVHNYAVALSLARDAYHGGRSECFSVGKLPPGQYYKLDVNALYPAMMAWYPQPRQLVKIIQNVTPEYLDILLRDYMAVAEVALETRKPLYTKEIAGRNCYPTGRFLTVLTTPELQQALIDRAIKGVGRVVLYKGADLFSEYVNFFTALRLEYRASGRLPQAQMCKQLQNSLQAKFGQHGYKQEVIGDAPLDKVAVRRWLDAESGRKCVDWTYGGKVIRQYNEGEARNSLPSIPAHVAAYGRLYMWSLIEKAGDGHVHYMDTDSLIVDALGFDNLAGMIDPHRLGYLKLEGIARNVEILARKDYRFGDLRTVKGIKSDAVVLAPNLFEQWHFSTIKYAFTAQDLDGVRLHKVKKELRYGRIAGTVEGNGRVRPPHLHLNPQDLFGYLADYEKDRVWVWEFEQEWLGQVERLEHLKERATYEIALFAKPKQKQQPAPLALQPVGA